MGAVRGEPLLIEKTHNHLSLGVIQHLQEEVGKAKDLVFECSSSSQYIVQYPIPFSELQYCYGRTTGIEPAHGGFTIHCLDPLGYIRPYPRAQVESVFIYDQILSETSLCPAIKER